MFEETHEYPADRSQATLPYLTVLRLWAALSALNQLLHSQDCEQLLGVYRQKHSAALAKITDELSQATGQCSDPVQLPLCEINEIRELLQGVATQLYTHPVQAVAKEWYPRLHEIFYKRLPHYIRQEDLLVIEDTDFDTALERYEKANGLRA